MATSRQIRTLSLQALYALDMADGRDPEAIRAAVESGGAFEQDESPAVAATGAVKGKASVGRGAQGQSSAKAAATTADELSASERRRAFDGALAAWEARQDADEYFVTLAPTWPPSRQPVIDRSILRLAWHEMNQGKTPPRVVVDEAIEMARAFSTDKSPAFINALLDKALKRFEGQGVEGDDTDDAEAFDEGAGGPAA